MDSEVNLVHFLIFSFFDIFDPHMGKIESNVQGITTELDKSEDEVIQYEQNDSRRVRRICL